LKQLLILYVLGMIDLRFGDEASFTMRPNVPYGWVKKGQQQTLPASRQKALNWFDEFGTKINLLYNYPKY
jgi:hypothetical protein